MFKFAAVFLLGIALTHAYKEKKSLEGTTADIPWPTYPASDESTPTPKGMSAMDFYDELVQVQKQAFRMAGDFRKLIRKAEREQDPANTGWDKIATAMSLVDHIGTRFEGIVDAVWHGHHDLRQDLLCDKTARLDQFKEHKEDVEELWANAMVDDLGCLKKLFASAKHIPVDKINSHLHENDALDVSVNVLRQTHLIHENLKGFGNAMDSIAYYLGHDDSGSDSSTTSAPGSGSDSGGDSGTTSAPGSGSYYSTDSGSDSGGDSGTTSAPGSGSYYSTDSGSDSGGDSGTTSAPGSGSYYSTDSGSDSGGDSGTTSAPGSDSYYSTDSGSDSGSNTNTTPGSDSSTDSDSLADEDKRVVSKLVRFLRKYSQR